MIHHRTRDEVRRFDIGKLIVLIILILLLLFTWFRARGQATQLDGDGGVAQATDSSGDITNDTAGDIALPALNLPGGTLESGTFNLTGTGEPGSEVAVLVDGVQAGTAEVGADGSWSLPLELVAGARQIGVQTLDTSGAVVNELPAVTIEVADPAGETDGEAGDNGDAGLDLELPGIDLPSGELTAGELSLSGVGTPGREVAVLVDGVQVGTTTVGDDGTWSLPVELTAGAPEVVVQTLDADGQVLNESEPLTLSLTAPVAPLIDVPETALAAGTVPLSGTAAPGAEVEIVVDGQVVGTATAGDDGIWSLDVDLESGEHEVLAQTLDADGDVASSSEAITLTVGDTAGGEIGEDGEDEEVATVLEGLETAGNFTNFLAAFAPVAGAGDAGDSGVGAEILEGEGPFTIFAPTDEAFANLPQSVQDALLELPEDVLSDLLRAHVVEGELTPEDIAAAETLTTAAGDELRVVSDDAGVRVDGATILEPVMTANGVFYPIDRIFFSSTLVPADMAPPLIDDSGVPTFACCALTVVGTGQPGMEIVLLANGEQYGQTATVAADGSWLVEGEVVIADYDLVALMFNEEGALLGVSPRVFLGVTE